MCFFEINEQNGRYDSNLCINPNVFREFFASNEMGIMSEFCRSRGSEVIDAELFLKGGGYDCDRKK